MTNIAGFKRIHDRKRKFHEKMVEVENELSGRMTSIVPYVTDDAGVFDAHKAKRMIDELVKDMNQYANHTLLWYGDIQKSDIPAQQSFCMYVEMFLYITIRVSLVDMGWIHRILNAVPQSNFQQILECAVDFKDYNDVSGWVFDRWYAGNVWFENVLDYACLIYEKLLGKNFKDLIPQKMWTEFEEEDVSYTQTANVDITDEKIDDSVDKDVETIWELCEELSESTEDRLLRKSDETIYKREIEKFVDADCFCKTFEKMISMLFSEEIPYSYLSNMKKAVEGMLDIFLCEHGLSLYKDTDIYKKAYTYLEGMEDKIETLRKEM